MEIIINFKDGTQAITDNWSKAENYYRSVLKDISSIFVGEELAYNSEVPLDSFLSFTPPAFKKFYKETKGKLFYELDWGFIKQMAERMSDNKKEGKYERFNWKRPMTEEGIEELKQATLRHLIEVMQGNYEDDGREFGHLEALSTNSMMINYQLKYS